jgi:hypothetical protein
MEPLEDRELNAILREWPAPEPPARLREKLFPPRVAWWQRLWQVQIRIPLPVAIVAALLVALGLWRGTAPRRVVVVPSVQPGQSAQVLTFRELTPVKELKPRIIRRKHAEN